MLFNIGLINLSMAVQAQGAQVLFPVTLMLFLHANDGWYKQEHPLLFGIGFATLFFTGAGRFSLDGFLLRKTS